MTTRVNYSGLVVAGIGFFLTRFTVTLAVYDDPVRFYLAGVVPLALGLGLAAFGVALAVADVDPSLVRTTALWCVVGAGTMLVLVVLTLLGSTPGTMADFASVRSQTYLSNFLIGGSVGGTLTGLYASRNRHQRDELERQANRLAVLNRLLRHEVLNAAAVIKGYAEMDDGDGDGDSDARSVIRRRADAIVSTIEEVKYLTRRSGPDADEASVDVAALLSASVEAVRERHPDADVSVESTGETTVVRADERVRQVFTHLVENAVVHGGDSSPTVTVTTTTRDVRVAVRDDGPGLPERQQSLLETGDIEEFDDPKTGFGLNVVRLLVENYGGRIDVDADDTGTTITVSLPRADSSVPAFGPSGSTLLSVRPATPHLAVTLVAALVAGVVYGGVSEALGGSVAGIGVFYGAADGVVGWLTHEFHSVVFGFAFVSLVSLAPERYRNDAGAYALVGLAWGLVVWIVAASFVAPVWLRLLGIDAPVPRFSLVALATHAVWGVSLGALTAWGSGYVTSWANARRERR